MRINFNLVPASFLTDCCFKTLLITDLKSQIVNSNCSANCVAAKLTLFVGKFIFHSTTFFTFVRRNGTALYLTSLTTTYELRPKVPNKENSKNIVVTTYHRGPIALFILRNINLNCKIHLYTDYKSSRIELFPQFWI